MSVVLGVGGRSMVVAHLLLVVLTQVAAGGLVEVEGRVVDAKGRPVAEAEVTLSGLLRLDQQRGIVERGTTDGQGRFRLAMPGIEDARTANFPWAVYAMRKGHGFGVVVFTREGLTKAEGEPLVVKLAAPEGSTVRVAGPSGEAVEGAKVLPILVRAVAAPGAASQGIHISNILIPDGLAERLVVTTGSDGRCTIDSVAPAELRGVRVEAPESGCQQVAGTTGTDGTFDVKLAPVGRISGKIVVEDPESLQGLKVNVFSLPEAARLGRLGDPDGRAVVLPDETGHFEAPALAIGDIHIRVEAPEDSQKEFIMPQNLSVRAGQLTEVTVKERRPLKLRTLTGRVVDSKGAAVEGALVFQSGDAPSRTETTSDTEGRFALPGVVETSTFVFACAKGYRFAGRGVKAGEKDVTVVLTGKDEAPAEKMATLAPVATREKESALAHRLIDGYAEDVLEKGTRTTRSGRWRCSPGWTRWGLWN